LNKLTLFLFISIAITGTFSCSKQQFNESKFDVDDHHFPGDYGTFFLPMVITPNGDFLNEDYRLFSASDVGGDVVTSFHLEITAGTKKLYSTDHYAFTWAGEDESGNLVAGMVDVKLNLGLNGKLPIEYKLHLYISRETCVPPSVGGSLFGDMIDARYGAIYQTQETFCP
jgi:hypothetical protein